MTISGGIGTIGGPIIGQVILWILAMLSVSNSLYKAFEF